MKMKREHYDRIREACSRNAEAIPIHRKTLAELDKKPADLDTRLAWDLFWSVGGGQLIKELDLYSYLDDTHITTALKAIVKELGR